jgi:hypothetical protein
MKKILAVAALAVLVASLPSLGGERPVCKIYLDDGGVVARSTAPTPGDLLAARPDTAGLGYATLEGVACPTIRLQTDGGIISSDGGLTLTNAAGTANSDGGVAGCPVCDFRGARSVVLQCKDPVYYSEQWDGGSDSWNQRGVMPATANHTLIDFDANPDGYRIDFRGGGATNHLSIKPVAASASNVCTVSTINRNVP